MRYYGELQVPGDKSISHRSIILGSLSTGTLTVDNFLFSEDTQRTINAFKNLGVKISVSKKKSRVTIAGKGKRNFSLNNKTIYCGNSGTTARLLAGCLSGLKIDCKLTGDNSLSKRPMKRVIIPLTQMNAKIQNEFLPVTIHKSNLKGIAYKLPVASAQIKSAVLLAGINAKGTTTVIENNKSRDHTERMMKFLEGNIIINKNKISVFENTNFISNKNIFVPADISSAAFFIIGALLKEKSKLILKNISLNKTRIGLIKVLIDMGANININNRKILNNEPVGDIAVEYSPLKSTVIKGAVIPKLIDEIPILSVAALFAKGKTIIKDAGELRVKESDRIKAIVTELSKVSNGIKELPDGIEITGNKFHKKLLTRKFESYNDHRIAMALEIMKNIIDEDITINNKDCVNISYPNFFSDMKKISN